MLTSPRLERLAVPALGGLASVGLPLVLALLLAGVCLVQLAGPVHPAVFIRTLELVFAGLVLASTAGRTAYPVLSRPMACAGFAWLGAAMLSVAFAGHLWPALIWQAEWLAHVLFAITLWIALRHTPALMRVAALAAALGFVLVVAYLAVTWIALPSPQSYDWFASPPLFRHVRHLGYYALGGLLCCAAPLLGAEARTPPRAHLLAGAGMALCWAVLFWTGGRAAIGAGAVGLFCIMAGCRRGSRLPALLAAAVAAGLGLWLSTLFAVEDPRLGFLNSLARTAADTAEGGANGFTTGRLAIWAEAVQAAAAHPWLGLGPDNYRLLPPQTHGGVQPHSLFVQFFVDWGLLGAVPMVVLLTGALWQGLARLWAETDAFLRAARVAALAFIVSAGVHSLVDGLFYHAQPLLFLAVAFAVALQPAPGEAHAPRPHARRLSGRAALWTLLILLALLFLLTSNAVYRWLG